MQVYIGIDWSEEKHDVIFMNEAGADLASMCMPHSLEGFAQFDAARQKLGLATQRLSGRIRNRPLTSSSTIYGAKITPNCTCSRLIRCTVIKDVLDKAEPKMIQQMPV